MGRSPVRSATFASVHLLLRSDVRGRKPTRMSLANKDKEWIGTAIKNSEAGISAKIDRLEALVLAELRKTESPAELRKRTRNAVLRVLDLEVEATANPLRKPEPLH